MEHRRVGYQQALAEAGLPLDPALEWEVIGYPDIDQEALAERLQQPERPTAIFAANDQLAIAVQRVARSLKLNIPQDLALVGFDNLEISAQLEIPLTTVTQPAFDIGKVACQLVIQMIDMTSTRIQQAILPTQLIIRSSCGDHQRR
jgi:LacI family transcriptional regulator